jgi:hypothetical protein
MIELFYWKEMERRARAAQALAMLHNRRDADRINQANAILDQLCLDRKGAERLIRSRMPQRSSLTASRSPRAVRPEPAQNCSGPTRAGARSDDE